MNGMASELDSKPDGAHPLLDLPVGTRATGTRQESDSLGAIDVPAEHYWGAQTERSLAHFSMGEDRMPKAVYRAYGYVKKAAAVVNARAGRLPPWMAAAISKVADEIVGGELDAEFPLPLWQSGSGTQTNMNVNEVISNRVNQLLGARLGSKQPVHPNDHVNLSQSSNDTFPSAMHIAAVREVTDHLLPRVEALTRAIGFKSHHWQGVVKIGRTHLQDAVPLTVGQEWSGYAAQLEDATAQIRHSLDGLYRLAIGGTAVGTGFGAPAGFGEEVAAEIARLTGYPFVTAPNKFAALAAPDAMVAAMAALRALAVDLMKIANDLRWLASGPRCGLGELRLPANEPGSSIMPGKVNPSQCEALIMIAIEVLAEDTAVAAAASQGNFELNTLRPLMIHNVLHSARLLADGCENFRIHCVEGVELEARRVHELIERSLMLVTALSPVIGYDNAAAIARQAAEEGTTLREAAVASGRITAEAFDRIVVPERMVGRP